MQETGAAVAHFGELSHDFPGDPVCETVEDQFMFGLEILAAPVFYEGARERKVYLPAGTGWLDARNGRAHAGGQWIVAAAPLETIPVFLRTGSQLQGVFESSRS